MPAALGLPSIPAYFIRLGDKSVYDAGREYMGEMDVLSAFLDACCEQIPNGEVNGSVFYSAYARWADENNEYKMSGTKFGREMGKRFEKIKIQSVFYKGVSLLNEPQRYIQFAR